MRIIRYLEIIDKPGVILASFLVLRVFFFGKYTIDPSIKRLPSSGTSKAMRFFQSSKIKYR